MLPVKVVWEQAEGKSVKVRGSNGQASRFEFFRRPAMSEVRVLPSARHTAV